MTKNNYMKQRYVILSDFGIPVTKEIKDKLDELYPNEVAIERYTKDLILKYLNKGE